MKSFLAFLAAMGIIVALGDAYCLSKRQQRGKVYRGCMWNGKLYPLGHIERTEDCYSCHCSRTQMTCCALFSTRFKYDKENCKLVVNRKTCKYDLVLNNDPSKECSFIRALG